jgi:membrane protease subunit HflC
LSPIFGISPAVSAPAPDRSTATRSRTQTYADSFGKDPQFYDFYRAMQSYDATFAQKGSSTSIVLSPDNEYLKQFKGK